MKKFRKLASTALALILAMALSLTAFAATEDETGMVVDDSISVSGLQSEDSVSFYKILEWDDGWKACAPFDTVIQTDAAIEELIKGAGDIAGGITAEMAGELGKAVSADTDAKYTASASGGAASVSNPEAGLYMAIITPKVVGYVYNPVFVAADFARNVTNAITLENGATAYADDAKAKLNLLDVEKTGEEITVAAGDTVEFKVYTTVPGYAANYTDPMFTITDKLSDNLLLNGESITVSVIDKNSDEVLRVLTVGEEYTVSIDSNNRGFVISFAQNYLYGIVSADRVMVEYNALVNIDEDTPTTSVTSEDNTVTVEFSNDPTNSENHGSLRDKTMHYTFDIDGLLFGNSQYGTTEVVKVAVDNDGNYVTEEIELSNGNSVGPLAGAKFALYKDAACTEVYENLTGSYGEIISGPDGRMNIRGLDEGTYYLKELEAPTGYIKAPDAVEITIEAVTSEHEFHDDEGYTYKMNVLDSYTVTIGGVATATYTIENKSDGTMTVDEGDTVVGSEGGNGAGEIQNTKGVELPSTGGIGTTIFYIVGIALILGAGVLLVVKKRVGGKEEA